MGAFLVQGYVVLGYGSKVVVGTLSRGDEGTPSTGTIVDLFHLMSKSKPSLLRGLNIAKLTYGLSLTFHITNEIISPQMLSLNYQNTNKSFNTFYSSKNNQQFC
jgi:hypothetical protein